VRPSRSSKARPALADVLTFCNLASGVAATVSAPRCPPRSRCRLILFAGFCDIVDGPLARRSGRPTELGAASDGIADLISFGVAPAVLLSQLRPRDGASVLAPGLYLAAAAWRLARYGIGPRTSDVFRGLPLTGGGIALAIAIRVGVSAGALRRLAFAIALAMVSRVPVPSGAGLARRATRRHAAPRRGAA
jgi:CDP-diacylglycerol---serine O-phosphatidyltransferase